MRKSTITLTVFAIVALVTAGASAFPGGKGDGRGHGKGGRMGMPHRLMEKLELTEAQKTEAAKLREEMEEDTAPIRENIKALKDQMRTLWSADPLDEAAILKLQKKIHGRKGELMEIRTQMRIDFQEILTPEQRARMKELKETRRERDGKDGLHKDRRGKDGRGKDGRGQEGWKHGRGKGNPDAPCRRPITTPGQTQS